MICRTWWIATGAFSAAIAADCATAPRCTFLDVATPMLTDTGDFRPELFREDRLHMLPAGYAIWTRLLAPLLQP